MQDTSPLRAADVLNTLIDVYNQESIDDQQRILDYSEAFINERITYLMIMSRCLWTSSVHTT